MNRPHPRNMVEMKLSDYEANKLGQGLILPVQFEIRNLDCVRPLLDLDRPHRRKMVEMK